MKWTAAAAIALGLAVMLGAFGAHGLRARLARLLDRRTLEAADLVLLDTETHRDYVRRRITARAATATRPSAARATSSA